MELLDAAIIQQQLNDDARRYFAPIEIFSLLDSTNTYLLNHTLPTGTVCLAEQQTAGYGRMGRTWISPYASNIYMSVLCEVPNSAQISALSLVSAYAVVEALSHLGVQGLQIKWPNDIVFEECKLAGILLEVAQQTSNSTRVVIGIGVNVQMPSDEKIDQPWVDIISLQPDLTSRNLIIANILNALYRQIILFSTKQLSEFMEHWRSVDALYEQAINIQQGTQTLTGIAQGINEAGMLIVKKEDGTLQKVSSGEVTKLRKT